MAWMASQRAAYHWTIFHPIKFPQKPTLRSSSPFWNLPSLCLSLQPSRNQRTLMCEYVTTWWWMAEAPLKSKNQPPSPLSRPFLTQTATMPDRWGKIQSPKNRCPPQNQSTWHKQSPRWRVFSRTSRPWLYAHPGPKWSCLRRQRGKLKNFWGVWGNRPSKTLTRKRVPHWSSRKCLRVHRGHWAGRRRRLQPTTQHCRREQGACQNWNQQFDRYQICFAWVFNIVSVVVIIIIIIIIYIVIIITDVIFLNF